MIEMYKMYHSQIRASTGEDEEKGEETNKAEELKLGTSPPDIGMCPTQRNLIRYVGTFCGFWCIRGNVMGSPLMLLYVLL